jgi:2-polyprenyl-3-methyl-5-hydroxy-6-metoxy-1,4-benzoquinol methylase
VDGVDYSQSFVDTALKLQKNGQVLYAQNGEGQLKREVLIDMTMYAFRDSCLKAQFFQGDACALDEQFKGYDLVMATNLIDRLYQPKLFLNMIHERLNEGGILVLTSPYTWREEYTQKQFWLGGYEDVPFVIRETARKFQHTISQMSVWRKR